MIAIAFPTDDGEEPNDLKAATMEARLILRSVFRTTEDELIQKLIKVQGGRNRMRGLTPHDVQTFLRDLSSFTSLCIEHGLPLHHIYGYLDGGAVTNDSFLLSTQVHVNGSSIRVDRNRARSIASDGRWLTHTKGISEIGYKPMDISIEDKVRDLGWLCIRGVRGCWRP